MNIQNTCEKLFILVIMLVSACSAMAEEYVRTDRYSLAKVEVSSDQRAPLTTIISLSFGVDVKTVGEAITELLQGSGYQWVPNTNDQMLQTLPLPAVMRTLGPVRLDDALRALAGSAWVLSVDELHRSIGFDIAEVKSTHNTSVNR